MQSPVIIEAAISPIQREAPAMTNDEIAAEAIACLDAGASIVHSHHDSRLDTAGAVAELIDVWGRIREKHPNAIFYPGFVRGRNVAEKTAHLAPLAQAGVLGMVPLDPGSVTIGEVDENGMPAYSNQYVNSYQDSNHLVELAGRLNLGVTVGVFEPGFLRVALAYAAIGKLPRGSLIKLYFGGEKSIYHPGRRALNYGLPPRRESLEAYLAMLEGTGLPWSARVSGESLLATPIARLTLERGGHLRVGNEDEAGTTGRRSHELVAEAVRLAERIGRPVAAGASAVAALGSVSQ